MKKISINGTLKGTFAILNVETTYKNESSSESLETTYHFPLEKETTLVKLEAQIVDRNIVAKVNEIEEAKELYDDAIAAGNSAVLA